MGKRNLLEQGLCQHYDNLVQSDWDVMYQMFVRDGYLIVIPMNFMHDLVIRSQFSKGDLQLIDRTKVGKSLTHDELLQLIDIPKKNIENYCIVMYVTPSSNQEDLYIITYKGVDYE